MPCSLPTFICVKPLVNFLTWLFCTAAHHSCPAQKYECDVFQDERLAVRLLDFYLGVEACKAAVELLRILVSRKYLFSSNY